MLPPRTYITFDYQSFRSDHDEQRRLNLLIDNAKTPLEKALLYSQKKNIRAITERGDRQLQTLTVYVQSPLNSSFGMDLFDKAYAKLESLSTLFSSNKAEINKAELGRKLQTSYDKTFRRFYTSLSKKFKHSVRPLSAQEMIDIDYHETHNGTPPDILQDAQMLIVTETGMQAIATGLTHVNALLFRGERGRQAVPVQDRDFIKLPAKGKVVGAMQVGKMRAFEHPQGADLGQIRFMADLMDRSELEDYRIVTQIGSTNALLQSFLLEREGKGSIAQVTKVNQQGNNMAVAAAQIATESANAQLELFRGKTINSVGCLIWLSRNTPRELSNDFEVLETALDATISEHCKERIFDFWKQSQPWCATPLLTSPYKRTVNFQSDEATGLIQQLKPCTLDKEGIHFLSLLFKSPVHLDIFTLLAHLLICATTRAGKSVLMGDIIVNYFFRNIPVVAFDFPRPTDGTSSYYDLVKILARLGGKASYFKTREESLNLIHRPYLEGLPNQTVREDQILSFHVKAIIIIVLGDLNEPRLNKIIKTMIKSSYKKFQEMPEIQERYARSQRAKVGSADWNSVPTLWDYLAFLDGWFAEYRLENVISETQEEAMSMIRSELRSTLEGEYGNAIAKPTSFDPYSQLLVFALQDISDPNEAAIMALAAYSALLSRAMSSPNSAFLIDETPILFQFPAISEIIKHLCTNGLKTGTRVVIGSQTASAITDTPAGKAIMETMRLKMVGWIVSDAVDSFVESGFRRKLVEKYTSRPPEPSRLASYWLIRRDDDQIEVEYIPSDLLLAIIANNPDEQAARDRIMEMYSNPLEGISAFAALYSSAKRGGISMDEIGKTLVPVR